ncbi:MAG: protein-L-isoaspartate(D-aspartate) O-methyltransferase [Candidatus Omnitrophota bacterium]
MGDEFDRDRQKMVDEQLISRGIKGNRLIRAFRRVPRHIFIPKNNRSEAYDDHPVSLCMGQTISQPYIVALMTESLCLAGSERVLEIGTGSGYQTAILAELADTVFTVERLPMLADSASRILGTCGYTNIEFKYGDGTIGWPEKGPYDRILVTAGAPRIPNILLEQLKIDGKLVAPVGGRFGQVLTIVEKGSDEYKIVEVCGCVFVPLIGKEGWSDV